MTSGIPGLLVIWAYLPHTTFPPAVTNPSELTSTSIIVYVSESRIQIYPPRQHTKLCVHRTIGVFLDPNNRTLDGNRQFLMRDVCLFHP
jgi:hypothetical protein